jgi:hypothetical protein
VAIIKDRLDGIVSHGFYSINIHAFLANLENFLARAMTLDLGRGRMNSQVFTGQVKGLFVKGKPQYPGAPVQVYLGGNIFTHDRLQVGSFLLTGPDCTRKAGN